MTKREAFQILLAKLRLPTMRAGTSFMSLPGVLLVASVKRSASVPYSSITSSGSMTLPSDLLILRALLVAHQAVQVDRVEGHDAEEVDART